MAPTVNCFKERFDRYSADNRTDTAWNGDTDNLRMPKRRPPRLPR